MQHHGNQRRTAATMRAIFQRYLTGIADRPADHVQVSDVQQLKTFVGENIGRPAANRALEILKAVFNRAIKWQLVDMRNPCDPVSLYSLAARDPFLSAGQVRGLFKAMENGACSQQFAVFVKTCLYTGVREMNVASLRWQDIDTTAKTWHTDDQERQAACAAAA